MTEKKDKKNIKVAICLSGLLRDWEQSMISIKNKLIDSLIESDAEVDLFIHSWESESTMIDDKWKINVVEETNTNEEETHIHTNEDKPMDMRSQSVSKIIDIIHTEIFPVTDWQLEKQSTVTKTIDKIKKDLGKDYKKKWSPHNFSCWLYSLYKSTELKNNFAKFHNIEYDYVIRVRTELHFEKKLTMNDLELVPENGILIPKGGDAKARGINDMFAIGTSESIDWYCDLVHRIKDYNERNPHQILSQHVYKWEKENQNANIIRFDFPYKIRGNKPSGM